MVAASKTNREAPRADVLVRVRGIVQGVGFRPFVHRVASRLNLGGWVRNDPQGVLIRASGSQAAVDALLNALKSEPPSAARVHSVEAEAADMTSLGELSAGDFEIVESQTDGLEVEPAAPPDFSLCSDCRRELLDPKDRRYRYPFINCTQCGPRYSILERLPYDRPHTTMRAFRMCPACQAEYDDPADRRFHAQPNACPVCGPRVVFSDATDAELEGERGLAAAVGILKAGGILAVKGIGGYHLMADACNEAAVVSLRVRKHREAKPFAVMFPNLAAVDQAAVMSPEAEGLLASPAAPIVLLTRRTDTLLARSISPDNPWIGAFLPSAPLQVLLLESFKRPVVATSGNLAEEPLCTSEYEAHRRLAGIADAFLDHNRRIAHPVDDSVIRLSASGPVLLRRARGYAPAPLRLPGRLDGCLLCVGAQMKSTLAVASRDSVVLSPHIGDLDGPGARAAFSRTADMLGELCGSAFTRVACDRHPDYASTRYAENTGLPRIAVQHHLAHILSCLLEHDHPANSVLGIACDGTGYGEDGTIWGGEFILLQAGTATRFGRLRPFRLAGGEAAIRDGRRSALGLVHAADPSRFAETAAHLGFSLGDSGTLRAMLSGGLNSPVTSSVGRLFDAVGALLGIGGRNQFEGQTPMAVEAAAIAGGDWRSDPHEEWPLRSAASGSGAFCELDWEPFIDFLRSSRKQLRPEALAGQFHRGLANGFVSMARVAGAGTVALSGGCFQNTLLLNLARSALQDAGFNVLTHHDVPPNDGGIAAGQALAALWGLTSVKLP